jgi:hypothetical protein
MIGTASMSHTKESALIKIDAGRARLYRLGSMAAVLIIITGLLEIVITFLPGGYFSADTISDWFALLQNNWFLGLRNLGLLNIIMTLLGIPMFLALYTSLQDVDQPFPALALIFSLVGVAVFYSTNRAFSMFDLSHQYAAATTDAQKTILLAAGQAMLSVGESHTPGTFMGFFLSELAGILISAVMLRSGIFNKAAAYSGMIGFSLLLAYDICVSFLPGLSAPALIFAMAGGLLSLAWYVLIARRLSQLANEA